MAYLPVIWILTCSVCVATGWFLSAIKQLNLGGYIVCFALIIAAVLFRFRFDWAGRDNLKPGRLFHRLFHRAWPRLFTLTAVLIFLGGVFYAPNNYDALTYRFPRVLHWWHEQRWHWIMTANLRMNNFPPVFEFLMMPLFIFSKSDRLFFLLNFIPFLLMPGLIFSVYRRLGASPRIAWMWMWVLPMGFCFVLEAGSIGNDLIAAVLVLASLHFGLRAKETGQVREVWLGLLAAGLLTGVKPSNLPLLLPLCVLLPGVLLMRQRPVVSLFVIAMAGLISFAPTAILNQEHTGHWSGDPDDHEKVRITNPAAGVVGNSIELTIHNLTPPILPLAFRVEKAANDIFPKSLFNWLRRDFPRFEIFFRELPQEESAGLGLGLMMIVVGVIFWSLRLRGAPIRSSSGFFQSKKNFQTGLLVGLLAWVALFFYMAKAGSETPGRVVSAYYPLVLLPFLFCSGARHFAESKKGQFFALIAAGTVLVPLILTPSRPLVPVQSVLQLVSHQGRENHLVQRAGEVYSVYHERNNLFRSLQKHVPDSVAALGFIGGEDDAETSLWRPYGSRYVADLAPPYDVKYEWVMAKHSVIESNRGEKFETWVQHSNGEVIATTEIIGKVSSGPERWSLVRFKTFPP